MRVFGVNGFKSQYSGRIYELLYQRKYIRQPLLFSDEFKELLGLIITSIAFSNMFTSNMMYLLVLVLLRLTLRSLSVTV